MEDPASASGCLDMSIVLGGSLCAGWSSAVVEALRVRGVNALGAASYDDPFALLMYRAKALRESPDIVIVETDQDAAPRNAHIERLLVQLATLLIPPRSTPRIRIQLDVDEHEYFARRVADGAHGSFGDVTRVGECAYLNCETVKTVRVSPYVIDTPTLLRSFLMTI